MPRSHPEFHKEHLYKKDKVDEVVRKWMEKAEKLVKNKNLKKDFESLFKEIYELAKEGNKEAEKLLKEIKEILDCEKKDIIESYKSRSYIDF